MDRFKDSLYFRNVAFYISEIGIITLSIWNKNKKFGFNFSEFSSFYEPISLTDHFTHIFYEKKTMALRNHVVKKIGVNTIGDVNE